MRISTSADRPTVSIQNGRPICLLSCSDSVWSSSEKNGFGPGGGMSPSGRKSTISPSRSCGDAADLRLGGVLRIAFVDVDQRGDVGHHPGGEPLGDDVPVPLHEHESDHRLQDHHRQDDDQQSAGVEALGHDAVEQAGEAPPAVADLPEPAVDAGDRGNVAIPVPGIDDAAERRADGGYAGVEAGHVEITSR